MKEQDLSSDTPITKNRVLCTFSRWLSGKESHCHRRSCRRPGLHPWIGKIPWRRKWQPIPVFLPGESHGQRSLAGYSPRGRKESDMPELTHYCCQLPSHSGQIRTSHHIHHRLTLSALCGQSRALQARSLRTVPCSLRFLLFMFCRRLRVSLSPALPPTS